MAHRIQHIYEEISEKIVIMHGRPRVKDVGPQNPEKVKAAEKKVRTGGTFAYMYTRNLTGPTILYLYRQSCLENCVAVCWRQGSRDNSL